MTVAETETFPFRFDRRYRTLALPFGVTPRRSWVRVGEGLFHARFGPWAVRTPVANLGSTEVTGPYGVVWTGGPARLSFTDLGLTFATNPDTGLCIRFLRPVKGIDPTGLVRHPGLTVTVADVDGLARAIEDAR